MYSHTNIYMKISSLMRFFVFINLLGMSELATGQQKKVIGASEPIQCLTTHIDADKDPKPVLENTGNTEWDNLQFYKKLNEWQRREEQRNPKSLDRVTEAFTTPATINPNEQTIVEPQRINPIQYILDKGIATKEKILLVAPHFPFITGESNNEAIIDYLQTDLQIWTERYPLELEAFYDEIINPDDIAKIPEIE